MTIIRHGSWLAHVYFFRTFIDYSQRQDLQRGRSASWSPQSGLAMLIYYIPLSNWTDSLEARSKCQRDWTLTWPHAP